MREPYLPPDDFEPESPTVIIAMILGAILLGIGIIAVAIRAGAI